MTPDAFIQARHGYFDGRNTPKWVVIHDAEYPKTTGAARWVANYFATTPEIKSAHYVVDQDEVIQSVQEQDGAFHTPGYIQGAEVNRNSIGVEHAGYASQTASDWQDAYGSAELERSAALVADIANRWGIPVKHLTPDEIRAGQPGIAGHLDFTNATRSGDHTDPGNGFPWDWYIGRIAANQNPGSNALATVGGLLLLAAVGALAYHAWETNPKLHRLIKA